MSKGRPGRCRGLVDKAYERPVVSNGGGLFGKKPVAARPFRRRPPAERLGKRVGGPLGWVLPVLPEVPLRWVWIATKKGSDPAEPPERRLESPPRSEEPRSLAQPTRGDDRFVPAPGPGVRIDEPSGVIQGTHHEETPFARRCPSPVRTGLPLVFRCRWSMRTRRSQARIASPSGRGLRTRGGREADAAIPRRAVRGPCE